MSFIEWFIGKEKREWLVGQEGWQACQTDETPHNLRNTKGASTRLQHHMSRQSCLPDGTLLGTVYFYRLAGDVFPLDLASRRVCWQKGALKSSEEAHDLVVPGRVSLVTVLDNSDCISVDHLWRTFMDSDWKDKELVVVETVHTTPSPQLSRLEQECDECIVLRLHNLDGLDSRCLEHLGVLMASGSEILLRKAAVFAYAWRFNVPAFRVAPLRKRADLLRQYEDNATLDTVDPPPRSDAKFS